MFDSEYVSLNCSIVWLGPSNVVMSEPVLDIPLKTETKNNIEGGDGGNDDFKFQH